jgi:hypothetical protein
MILLPPPVQTSNQALCHHVSPVHGKFSFESNSRFKTTALSQAPKLLNRGLNRLQRFVFPDDPPSSHPVVLKVLLALIPETQLDKSGKHRTTPKPQMINKKTKIRKGLKKDGEGGEVHIFKAQITQRKPYHNIQFVFLFRFLFFLFFFSSIDHSFLFGQKRKGSGTGSTITINTHCTALLMPTTT